MSEGFFAHGSNASMALRPHMGVPIMLLPHTNFLKGKVFVSILFHCV